MAEKRAKTTISITVDPNTAKLMQHEIATKRFRNVSHGYEYAFLELLRREGKIK